MQIIIPMSGTGQRFLNAGYKTIKPLIEADGKPIIQHVIEMFPGENDFTFICNEEHLETTSLTAILKKLVPQGKIISIEPHKKGPVYAVAQAFDSINEDDETIVNYCDFGKFWDYQNFLKHTRNRQADGAVSAYRGFHPHMLGTTNYAFIREEKQWMQEIREKTPFTDNRMNEFASDGTYYFRRGSYVKKYFSQLMEKKSGINGEFYVSLVYNQMLQDYLKISVYEIQHMLQWGEPRDLEEYQNWSNCFRSLARQKDMEFSVFTKETINLIPMAGRGQRFVNEGYQTLKPLIEVSGKPMVIQASQCLPSAGTRIFVCLKEHCEQYPIEKEIHQYYPQAQVIKIDHLTEGQACTCELGLQQTKDLDRPLLIGTSDNGLIWNQQKYNQLIAEGDVDCVVWSFRHHPASARHPQMYGWIKTGKDGVIESVSVKQPISSDPFEDHAIVGTFFFRKARYFLDALHRLQKKNIRVNGEFYVDSCVNEIIHMGLKAKVFACEHYVGWGTPNDLRTFEYWQSFFHKNMEHPYFLESDPLIAKERIKEYDSRCR
jgi:bifunctional N-acetylglucosamine-1-phosphate-uridyltransferase/glucosamine-1-phosphate-acetyltransferase GlmU-like protein